MPSERELMQQLRCHSARLAQSVADAEGWHRLWLEQVKTKQVRWMLDAEATCQQTVAKARSNFERRLQQATDDHERRAVEAEDHRRRSLATAEREYQTALADVTRRVQALIHTPCLSTAPWDHPIWESWSPTRDLQSAPSARIGQVVEAGRRHRLALPAIPGFPSKLLLFEGTGSAKDQAVQAVQSLLLRLLAIIPPGRLQFTFVDPIGRGRNVASFMHLADYDEKLVGGRAWTEARHIEQQLLDLTEHIENVNMKFLRDDYPTIEAYNRDAVVVAEPYRVLVVFDFPVNFTEDAARRLLSIAETGPQCGVSAVVLRDTEQELPHNFRIADLQDQATVITWNGRRYVWQDPEEVFTDCQLELDTPPDAVLVGRILKEVGEGAKGAGRVEAPFERIAPPAGEWWTRRSDHGLLVPLGPAGARRPQEFKFGGEGTVHNALVAGQIGSGKSSLLHTLISILALTYSPDELALYLIDMKEGVEFRRYAIHELPHARVVAVESEREFGLSVLRRLEQELKRRGELFGASQDLESTEATNIAAYRAQTGETLPRILLIVDEFQKFFEINDAIATEAARILEDLTRRGRGFGIHVLLSSQTLAGGHLGGSALPTAMKGQMELRIALQSSEADSRLILGDDNPAARLLSRPGEAYYNDKGGRVDGNSRFQVAWLPDEQQRRYLEQLRDLARKSEYQPPYPQVVFEGRAPARVAKNRLLSKLLEADTWPTPPRAVPAWLGEPLEMANPTAARFRRQSGSNLLIVGHEREHAAPRAAAVMTLVSLAAGLSPADVAFFVFDFSAVDAPDADAFERVAAMLPHAVKLGRRHQMPGVLAGLATEVQRRIEAEDPSAPARYLFLYGLQFARDLREDDDDRYPLRRDEPAPPKPSGQLATILRDGPDVGIHAVIWCDTLTSLNRTFDRRMLRELTMRVAFQMSEQDSASLIDTPAAGRLGPNRALLYSEDEGRVEKFRPYALPDESWLAWMGERLRARVGPSS